MRVCVTLLLLAAAAVAQAPAAPRPNILVFLVDDLGWNDSSVAFGLPKVAGANAHYRTPALERLAKDGVRFSQAYAHPVCTPTRVSLLTGQSTLRHGVTDWTLQRGKDLNATAHGLQLPEWNCNGLQPAGTNLPHSVESSATLPMLLAKAGYRTIHVGKAHFGALGTAGADPCKLGFDVNIAGHAAGAPSSHLGMKSFASSNPKRGDVWDVPGLEAWHGRDVTLAEALTDAALLEIAKAKQGGKPFFLHFAHYGVHAPIEPAKKYAPHYSELGLSTTEQHYAQMVEDVDTSLGRVLDALQQNGIADSTLVMFLSDNGGFVSRGGKYLPLNAPLRGGKGSGYEGGVRTPLVVRWPGPRPSSNAVGAQSGSAAGSSVGGTITTEIARVEDILPTCLDAAGVAPPQSIDGISLRTAVQGQAAFGHTPEQAPGLPQSRDLHWYYPHGWGGATSGSEPFAAIRSGDMKLIHFFKGNRVELFDLKVDPQETKDLSSERAELARALDDRLLAALKGAGRTLPFSAASK